MIAYLHGFASGPGSFKGRELRARFAAHGVALETPDLTPGPAGFEASSPRSMLTVVEHLLAGGTPPHALVGSSLGGYLSALAASRNPAISRLVLLAPAFRLFERWRARLGPDELARWQAEGLDVDHHATGTKRRLAWSFFEDAESWPAFPEVKVPALVIAGRHDATVPLADVEAWVARTPSARLVVVEDGHELAASIEVIFTEARAFLAPLTSR